MNAGRYRALHVLVLPIALAAVSSPFVACSTDTELPEDASSELAQDLAACAYSVTTSVYEGSPEYWGTIEIKNTGSCVWTSPKVSFRVPSGATCDYHDSGWTHTQSGSTCTYSRTSKVSVRPGSSLGFNFSTTWASSFTPSNIQLTDSSCGGSCSGGSTGSGGTSSSSGGSTGSGGTSSSSGGSAGSGGGSSSSSGGGTGSGSGTGSGGGAGAVWRTASLTWFESYPDPGSEECIEYNGCTWAGQFAALDGKQPESWVRANNIAAVHSKDFEAYKLKTLRLRKNGREIDVKVYDMCADSDCSGCCTANARPSGFLIDLEKYTVERFGVPAEGQVEWRCLDCN